MTTANDKSSPSFIARYSCLGVLLGIFGVWGQYSFLPLSDTPPHSPIEISTSFKYPLFLTVGYLISLPVLRQIMKTIDADQIYMKELLKESMVVYNVAQVFLNGWMVYSIMDALLTKGHPFIGDTTTSDLCSYAVWIHYCDKYLEFFDTYFMVLRGRMDQVSFLHVYHHFSIAWAWWIGVALWPAGDSYFGALLNSIIHVMMYSYYALALLGYSCPWKRYLTQAQLLQFLSVIVYTVGVLFWSRDEGQELGTMEVVATLVQVFEMVSLFILFSMFYKKAYKSKSKKGSSTIKAEDDACQAAVAGIATSAGELAKDASKIMNGAKKVAPVPKELENATSRPSWSIVS